MEPSVTILTPAGSDVGALWWPPHALGHLWSLRDTVARFYRRELERMYAGTALGLPLAVLQSLALLGVYTVVFGHVLGARLSGPGGGDGFGLSLFAALLTFNLFADSVAGAAGLLAAHSRLVTKPLLNRDGVNVTSANLQLYGLHAEPLCTGAVRTAEFELELPRLAAGSYSLHASVADGLGADGVYLDSVEQACVFSVEHAEEVYGLLRVPSKVRLR